MFCNNYNITELWSRETVCCESNLRLWNAVTLLLAILDWVGVMKSFKKNKRSTDRRSLMIPGDAT